MTARRMHANEALRCGEFFSQSWRRSEESRRHVRPERFVAAVWNFFEACSTLSHHRCVFRCALPGHHHCSSQPFLCTGGSGHYSRVPPRGAQWDEGAKKGSLEASGRALRQIFERCLWCHSGAPKSSKLELKLEQTSSTYLERHF